MTKLNWKRNVAEDCWELVVNNNVTITLDKCYGVWSVWMNDTKVADYIDSIIDAKEKGMNIAKAIRG